MLREKCIFSSSKWTTTFVPLDCVLFWYPCNFASRVPGKLWLQQFLIRGHYSHVRSFCCPSFFFPPTQMFSYVLILLPSLPKFLELCSTQSESRNIFSFVWSMLLPSTSLRYAWLFSKNKTFQPIGVQGWEEELAVSFSDNRVFTQFLPHSHKFELWDLVHLLAGQAAPLLSVTYWPSD